MGTNDTIIFPQTLIGLSQVVLSTDFKLISSWNESIVPPTDEEFRNALGYYGISLPFTLQRIDLDDSAIQFTPAPTMNRIPTAAPTTSSPTMAPTNPPTWAARRRMPPPTPPPTPEWNWGKIDSSALQTGHSHATIAVALSLFHLILLRD